MAVPLSSKACSACKLELPISNFGARPEYKDGYRNQCNPCRSKRYITYSRTESGIDSRKRANSKRQPGGLRWRKLRTKYGLTRDEYEALLVGQGNKCAVCQSVDPRNGRGVFVVDHCHDTGRVRGLLCTPCNSAIGNLGDTVEALEAALRYLRGS